MTISPLTDQAYVTSQKSSRNGVKIDHFIVHHAVSTNWRNVLDLMMGAKEVSANYIIANDGQIISVVPEEYRAWTSSSSYWDGRSITVEICNESLDSNAGYPISPAAQNSLARLIQDVGSRYGFVPTFTGDKSNPGTVLGHRDLVSLPPYQSYATACPGQYTYDRLPTIVADAGGSNLRPTGDDDMYDAAAEARAGHLAAPYKLYTYGTGIIAKNPRNGRVWVLPNPDYVTLLAHLGLTSGSAPYINDDQLKFIDNFWVPTMGDSTPGNDSKIDHVVNLAPEDVAKLVKGIGELPVVLSDDALAKIVEAARSGGADAVKSLQFVTVAK